MAQQTKTIENPNIFDITSFIIDHPKISHELSKTIKQARKVSQIGSIGNRLYSGRKKRENVLNKKI